VIHSLSTPESYAFDMKRPMRTVAMEPNFGKRGTRAFVCGGLSGNLVMRERGWIGHKETLLHSGEESIWQVRWRGKFIAWADDYVRKILFLYIYTPFLTFTYRGSRYTTRNSKPDSPPSTGHQTAPAQTCSNVLYSGKTTRLSSSGGQTPSKSSASACDSDRLPSAQPWPKYIIPTPPKSRPISN
jgi:hypothetical protein